MTENEKVAVVLEGLAEGAERAQAVASLAKLFKTSSDEMAGLVESAPSVLVKSTDPARGEKMKAAILKRGGRCHLKKLKLAKLEPRLGAVAPRKAKAPVADQASGKVCGACGYQRSAADRHLADYECPRCGAIYAKKAPRAPRSSAAEVISRPAPQASPSPPGPAQMASPPTPRSPEAAPKLDAAPIQREVHPVATRPPGAAAAPVAAPAASVDQSLPPGFKETCEAIYHRMTEAQENALESTGLRNSSHFIGTVGGGVAVLAGFVVGFLTAWYWGLGAFFLVVGITGVILPSLLGEKMAQAVEAFIFGLKKLDADPVLLHAVFALWQFMAFEDIKERLNSRFNDQWPNVALPSEVVDRVFLALEHLAPPSMEAVQTAMTKDPELSRSFEDRFPDATPRMVGYKIKFHPAFGIEFGGSFDFSISQNALFIISGEQVSVVPMEFVKAIKIGGANDGFSTDAIVGRLFEPLLNTNAVRVRIDLHLFVQVKVGGGVHDYQSLSFETFGEVWEAQRPRWEAAIDLACEVTPKCPHCGLRGIIGDTSTFMEAIGFSKPETKASCSKCKTKFVFDYGHGVLKPVRK